MDLPFLGVPATKTYEVLGQRFDLNIIPDVFVPSPHGILLAENISVGDGERVLDVGTGAGFLAILAAKLGGLVTAIDNDSTAVACCKSNAITNNVNVSVIKGDLLKPLHGQQFDVILANLPQEIIPDSLAQALGPIKTNAISGGVNGNEIMMKFLHQLSIGSVSFERMYLKINTLSKYKETLSFLLNHFSVQWLKIEERATKPLVKCHLQFYEALNTRGDIHIFEKDGEIFEENYIVKVQAM